MRTHRARIRPPRSFRAGFTLVELLVVVAIILILASITLATVNFSINADRVRSGARQIQSYLMGARDKAIYANELRGVRFLLDPNDGHSVSAMQYIGAPARETGGLTFSAAFTNDPSGRSVAQVASAGYASPWSSLYRRGLLLAGCRIQIPQGTGTWFTVSSYNIINGNPVLTLDKACPELANAATITYSMQLAAVPLSDNQPVQLPRGVVIDLDGSQVPLSWRASSIGGSYISQMDILFTPRGAVVGNMGTLDLAKWGMIHLLLADASDVVKWKSASLGISGRNATLYTPPYPGGYPLVNCLPIVPAEKPSASPPVLFKDRIIVSLTTRTGNVAVYPLNPTPASAGSAVTLDPYYYAETGQVANK